MRGATVYVVMFALVSQKGIETTAHLASQKNPLKILGSLDGNNLVVNISQDHSILSNPQKPEP